MQRDRSERQTRKGLGRDQDGGSDSGPDTDPGLGRYNLKKSRPATNAELIQVRHLPSFPPSIPPSLPSHVAL